MTFAERIVGLHQALAAAAIPHAFGGAIALGYAILNPRATIDIDVNIFLPAAEAERVLRALPEDVALPPNARQQVEREEQIRLWWDRTPVDLFFDYTEIHADASRHAREVPFGETMIPVLGPVELAVFKAMFDRMRDWADLEEMARAGTLDVDAVKAAVSAMTASDDPRLAKLDALAAGR